MIYHRNAQGEHGYTLVELSVVIGIIAVLVGATLTLGTARIDQQKVTSTKERMTLIERALKNYAEVNDRLPCPADARLNRTDDDFGLAAGPNGDCTSGSIAAPNSLGNIVSGGVPIHDLALPEDIMFDNWGRKFTYTVDIRHTRTDSFKHNLQNSTCGSIIIADEADAPITIHGMYVLLSHGKDGHGAYHAATGAPWQLNASVTNEAALDNAGLDAANAVDFDGRYRIMGFFEDGDDSNDRFDDIIRYKTRKDWRLTQDIVNENFNLNSKPTPAGWTYVPQYTLPSGKVVPAFEVMQYLASDADADGVPESVPDEAPLAEIPFDTARQYCQKLGYNAGMGVTGDGELMEYDIISDTQSAALAHLVLDDSRNWVDGCFGDNYVIAGHRDDNPTGHLAGGPDVNSGYYLTGNSIDDATAQERAERRTFFLPSGTAVWDLSGNGNQWSYCDWDYAEGENRYRVDNFAETSAYSLCTGNGTTNRDKFTDGLVADNLYYQYNDPAGIDQDTNNGKLIDILPKYGYDNDEFLGAFKGLTADTKGMTRGSSFYAPDHTGIFRIVVGYGSVVSPYARVFRCAHNFQGAGFSPRNLEGLDIWYDSSDIDGDFEEEWTASTVSEEAALLDTASATCTADNICVRRWNNKASNGKWHARSKILGGAYVGGDPAMPTFKFNAINGRPAINFSESTAQYFDTWHGIAFGNDDGTGYNISGNDATSIFIVGNASEWDNALNFTSDSLIAWPHFVYFPYKIGSSYYFLIDNLMSGADSTTEKCDLAGSTVASSCSIKGGGGTVIEYGPSTHASTSDADEIAHDIDYESDEGKITIRFTPTSLSASTRVLLAKDSYNDTAGHLVIYLNDDDASALMQNGAGTDRYVGVSDKVEVGIINELILTFGSASGLTLEVNGASSNNATITQDLTTNPDPFVIGASNWSSTPGTMDNPGNSFEGTIHEVLYSTNGSDSYACAKLGASGESTGLQSNQSAILTGIFKKGSNNGLTTYANGATLDASYSSVEAANENLGDLLGGCGTPVDMKLLIGADRKDTTRHVAGDIAEIIIYNRALTNKERIQVEKYLSEKYDITYQGPRGQQ